MLPSSRLSPTGTPERKRARIDEPDDDSLRFQHNKRHPTLYFKDGNVVLRCPGMDFRVHHTLLSKNSPVFRDLFTKYESTDSGEAPGCIVVPLDDDASDMECLLDRVYDGFHIEVTEFTIENFPIIAGLLRLSTKYQIERPRNVIFDLLRREWPSSLDLYDTKAAGSAAKHNDSSVVHPATVISLLRECGYTSPDLYAPLFYEMSTHISQFGNPALGNHLGCLKVADTQRLVVGINGLRTLHARLAACPLDDISHKACRADLALYWCRSAYPIIFSQANDMCRPIEDWLSLIMLYKAQDQPQPAPPLPNLQGDGLGIAPLPPPPPYNPFAMGPQAPQHQPAQPPQALGLYQAPRLQAPQMFQMYGADVGFWNHINGPLQPQDYLPGQAQRIRQPALPQLGQPRAQPQIQLPGEPPLPAQCAQCKREVCVECKLAVFRYIKASRREIWDSLPRLFNLV